MLYGGQPLLVPLALELIQDPKTRPAISLSLQVSHYTPFEPEL